MPNSSQFASSVSTCLRESSSAISPRVGGAVGGHVVVGGRQRLVGPAHLAAGHPQPLEGLRRGHLVDEVQVDVDQVLGDLVGSQILSNRSSGIRCSSYAAPQPGGDVTASRPRLGVFALVLEVVRQVGVEGDAVALGELVALAVDAEVDRALQHDRGLAAARLVHRRVVGAAGRGAGLERVHRDVGALPGSGGVSSSTTCPRAAARAALAGAGDDHVAALVEPQQLREGQVEPGGDLGRRPRGSGWSRRARPARASAR